VAHALETFLNAPQISHSIIDNSNHVIDKKVDADFCRRTR
jgi:hypothetical protein